MVLKTIINCSISFKSTFFCEMNEKDFFNHMSTGDNRRCFSLLLRSTHMYGWSIWPAEMLFWLKSHCYYVTLGSVKSTCPSPISQKRTTRPANSWLVQSQSLIFSVGESEISLEKSQEEVKDSWKTKSWICSSLLPHNYLALSCVPFFCPPLPHLVLTFLTVRPAEQAEHNLLPVLEEHINNRLIM